MQHRGSMFGLRPVFPCIHLERILKFNHAKLQDRENGIVVSTANISGLNNRPIRISIF